MDAKTLQRRRLLAGGQVQGVGFRPFVYRLALRHGLTGHVGNTSEGVRIEIQGTAEHLKAFVDEFPTALPPLARLTRCEVDSLDPLPAEKDFRIVGSAGHGGHSVLVSPDVAACVRCRADIRDPRNRRYRYPFTNCTDCGPRYTITRSIPYDRAATTMACFPLCPECRAEYDDPLDRRFHAQPNACPVCGPRVWLAEKDGEEHPPEGEEALLRAAQALRDGKIVAVKGLGGFHLACDARNAAAVAELRRRKQRPHKPLAVMTADLDAARTLAHVGPRAEALLTSPERPIVLCPRRADALPQAVSPDAPALGVMLPYTPLHIILLDLCAEIFSVPPVLVMTSGNAGGDPICLGNREALRRLKRIADLFLLHDRDILTRVDDSVVMPPAEPRDAGTAGQDDAPPPPPDDAPLFLRRARGYTPRPATLGGTGPSVLGAGAELKTALCLTRGREAFVSQHIGDMQNPNILSFYEETAERLEMLLETRPTAAVRDLHPDFMSTRFAEELGRTRGIKVLALQHHFAHAWSVLAEHGLDGGDRPVLALTLDGTGLGEDGTIWGGELLWVDVRRMEQRRMGRLRPFALPGGEAAVREPWRIAQGLLTTLDAHGGPWLKGKDVTPDAADAVAELVRRNALCVPTSSAGRLFDAVAALLGLCLRTTYEGQAAVRLEAAQAGLAWTAGQGTADGYGAATTERQGLWELDTQGLFAAVAEDQARGAPTAVIARRFHVGVAQGLADMAARTARTTGADAVALSGGVMQNAALTALLPHLLLRRGLTPLMHRQLPPNDGGVALGQAAWGRRMLG